MYALLAAGSPQTTQGSPIGVEIVAGGKGVGSQDCLVTGNEREFQLAQAKKTVCHDQAELPKTLWCDWTWERDKKGSGKPSKSSLGCIFQHIG